MDHMKYLLSFPSLLFSSWEILKDVADCERTKTPGSFNYLLSFVFFWKKRLELT